MDMVNFYGQADKEPPIINVVDQTPRISQDGPGLHYLENVGKNIGLVVTWAQWEIFDLFY